MPAAASMNLDRPLLRTVGLCGLAALLIVGAAWWFAPEAPRNDDGVESFVPRSGSEVVERLPRQAAASKRDLKERLGLPASRTQDPASAVAMARRHYDRARIEGEPRELGLAQAALAPWWDQPAAPVSVLLIRSAIRQYQHDFSGALTDLEQAILEEPGNIQAWLSQAAIQQTLGNLEQARRSCSRVVELSDHVAGHVCLADLASMRGDPEAWRALEQHLVRQRVGGAERGWILTVQAEMAERLGRERDAERHFRAAIAADRDSYPRVAYADFLLLHARHGEVEALLADAPPTDPVLLRRAIALRRGGDARAREVIEELRQRLAVSASRDDSLHLREMARFALDVDGDPSAALALARRNWVLQKEPADALLLAGSARAAGNPEGAAPLRDFVRLTGLSDVRLDALL
jgi:tetratricopeptide (TPR) repeat protein